VVSLRGEPATVTHVVAGEVMVRWDLDRTVDRVLYREEYFGLLDYPPSSCRVGGSTAPEPAVSARSRDKAAPARKAKASSSQTALEP
jgi:hypothetical protein